MAERGIRAYKIFMVVDTGRTYPHPAGTGMHDHGDLLRMMDLIAPTGLPFMIHPHDQALMDYIEGEILARGENTPQGYAAGLRRARGRDLGHRLRRAASGSPRRPTATSTSCTCRRARSIDAVRRAKARGIKVTCEVNHWALFLAHAGRTSSDSGPYALSYWVPDERRAAVWEGLQRRHDRHALLRPRAAHARGEGGRLDRDVERPHRHARHPVPAAAAAGRGQARASSRSSARSS